VYLLPRTRIGRVAVGLLLPVLFYPAYWWVFQLVPLPRWVSIGVVAVIVALALSSVVVAWVAILARRDRSLLLLVAAVGTTALVAFFAVGEALGH